MNDFVIDKRLEEDLLSKLSPEEVKKAIDEVYAEMITGVEVAIYIMYLITLKNHLICSSSICN